MKWKTLLYLGIKFIAVKYYCHKNLLKVSCKMLGQGQCCGFYKKNLYCGFIFGAQGLEIIIKSPC